MNDGLWPAACPPLDPTHRLFVGYLLTAFVVALGLAWSAGHRSPMAVRRWVFPRPIWIHPSTRTDAAFIMLQTLIGPALGAAGLAWTTGLAVSFAHGLETTLGPPGWLPWGPATAAALTISLVAVTDFSHWLNHWLHHKVPLLWPLHAVHHSAPVLTPLTLYRRHPVYDAIKKAIEATTVGLFQGGLVYLFAAPLDVWTLGGLNVIYLGFLVAGSNLRHTHMWWSWGPLDHLFVSPAQHQLHHSNTPDHEGNYGSLFAFWDTLAGTRIEARVRPPDLTFGLFRGCTHDGVWDALWRPLAQLVWRRRDG